MTTQESTQQNTFTRITIGDQHQVRIVEPSWNEELIISKDLVDDSPYIEMHEFPGFRPVIEITVSNGNAMYEMFRYDAISELYTCRLMQGKVF